MPTGMVTFIQATYVLATFVHINNIQFLFNQKFKSYWSLTLKTQFLYCFLHMWQYSSSSLFSISPTTPASSFWLSKSLSFFSFCYNCHWCTWLVKNIFILTFNVDPLGGFTLILLCFVFTLSKILTFLQLVVVYGLICLKIFLSVTIECQSSFLSSGLQLGIMTHS